MNRLWLISVVVAAASIAAGQSETIETEPASGGESGAAATVEGSHADPGAGASSLTLDLVHDAWENYEREHAPWPSGSEEADAFTEVGTAYLVSRIGTKLQDVRRRWGKLTEQERMEPLPLAVYADTAASESLSGQWGALQWLDTSIKGFLESGESHLRCAAAANRLGQLQDSWRQDERAVETYKLSLEQFQLACAEPGLNALEQRYVLTKLPGPAMSFLEVEWLDGYFEQFGADERIDPWLRDMVVGTWHFDAGWRARGTGYANTVTDEGWRVLGERATRAETYLRRAYESHPDRPEAAREMIKVAMAGYAAEGETEWVWFDRAIAAQFDYLPAYHAMSWALRPRWGGSVEEMVRFGLQCAATQRYDTMVPLFLVEALIDVCEDMEDFDAVWRQHGIYPAVKRVMQGCIADPVHAARVDHLRAEWAVVAWKARQYDEAREQLSAVGKRLEPYWLDDFNVHQEEMKGDLYARTGEAADAARRAARAASRGDWDEAVSLLEGVPAKQRSSVADPLATARFMRAFETGAWTELPPARSLQGWRVEQGKWTVLRNRLVATETGGNMRCILGAPVGQRFEMEVVVDATGARDPKWSSGGILFRYSARTQSPQYWTLRASPDSKQSVAMGRRLYNSCDPRQVATTGKDRLRLVLWDDWAQGSVNGEVVFQGKLPLRKSDHPGDRIGLCSHRTLDGNTLAFSEVRIRKLTEPPLGVLEQEWAEQDAAIGLGTGDSPDGGEEGEAIEEGPPE